MVGDKFWCWGAAVSPPSRWWVSFEYAREIAKKEGILVGISTGASLAAVAKKAATLPDDAQILTFNYDTGERYLSIEGLF
jgi:cysteine synthase A